MEKGERESERGGRREGEEEREKCMHLYYMV